MEVTKDFLLRVLNDNGMFKDDQSLGKMYKKAKGVSAQFLEQFIKTSAIPTDKELVERITPIPMFTALIKCPLMLKHTRDRRIAHFKGNKERDSLLNLLKGNAHHKLDAANVKGFIEGEELSVSYDAFEKVFNFVDHLVKKESDGDYEAVVDLEAYYTIDDPELKKPLMSYKNYLSIKGKDGYHAFFVKVVNESMTEKQLEIYNESLFLTALAAVDKAEGKEVYVNLMLLLPDDMLLPVRWHIPGDFMEKMKSSPSRLVKKYISFAFKGLPENLEDVERLKVLSKKIQYCSFCGYNWIRPELFPQEEVQDET